MGNLYRFVEPVLLFLLKRKGRSYGYELASMVREYALTDAEVEVAALYKTLRQLEQNDCVTSEWEVQGSGPARRVYALTPRGEQHLDEWIVVLGHMSKAMTRFVRGARAISTGTSSGAVAQPVGGRRKQQPGAPVLRA
jgi:DNA-binding PadR family transcriptional regulator